MGWILTLTLLDAGWVELQQNPQQNPPGMNYPARVIPTKPIVSFPGAKDHARVIPAKAGIQSFQDVDVGQEYFIS
jgi:hypothetical protein